MLLVAQQVSLNALWYQADVLLFVKIQIPVDRAVSAEQISVYQLFQELRNLQEPADINTGSMFQTDLT